MTSVDKFFATLGLGGRVLEKIQIRKGERWGIMLKFSQGKGFFMGNYIPFFMKPYADKAQIKKYKKSRSEVLFVDRKSYEAYQAMYEKDQAKSGNGKGRQERTEVYQRTKLKPFEPKPGGISIKDIEEAQKRIEEEGGL